MNSKQIFKIINSYQWKEEEASAAIHIIDHWKTCYLDGNIVYKRKIYSTCTYLLEEDYAFEWVRKDEVRKVFVWALEKYKTDQKYFKNKYLEFNEVSLKIKDIFKKVRKEGLTKFKNKELGSLLLKIYALGRKQYGYALIPECLDILSDKDYADILKGVSSKYFSEIIHTLSTPEKLSFMEREKLHLLKLVQKALKDVSLKKAVLKNKVKELDKFKNFLEDLENHTNDYFWIQNSFKRAFYLDKKYFLNAINEEVKKKTGEKIEEKIKKLSNKEKLAKKEIEKIEKKYKLTKEAKIFFKMARDLSFLQDSRKENVQTMVFCMDQILGEAGKRRRVPKSDLYNYFIVDVINLLEENKKIPQKELAKRRKTLYFSYMDQGKIRTTLLFGQEAIQAKNYFRKENKDLISSKTINGFVASIGKGEKIIKGKVKIVFDPGKDTFNKGEILVTGMTRPEFVPLMKKARAIITNEGGITTHAAIISRELKVPCIIGTKVATQILKSGDLVEINISKGIVKIIK